MSTSIRRATICLLTFLLAGCAGDRRHVMIVSVADQEMLVLRDGQPVAVFPVSTSRFGLGDTPGSHATPTGKFVVRKKIGDALPSGAVLKSRRPTGEILPVNAPGRDPIVTRILWLHGLEPHNRNAFDRFIYIHGTPEERTLGTPSSYGCVRMRSADVIQLYDMVGEGARVKITESPLPRKSNPEAVMERNLPDTETTAAAVTPQFLPQ